MNRFTKKEEHLGARPGRMLWIVGVVLLVCVAAFFRMRSMMVKSEDSYAATAQTKSTKTLTVYGMRGTIYDTNMVPLAYDRTSYNVAFYRDPSKASEAYRASYTQVILKTIELVEAMGKSTVSDHGNYVIVFMFQAVGSTNTDSRRNRSAAMSGNKSVINTLFRPWEA